MPVAMSSRDPSRILMVGDAIGGVWHYAIELAAGLAKHGIETILVVVGPAPDDEKRTAAKSIGGLRLIEAEAPLDWTASKAEMANTAKFLSELATRFSVDLVHLNAPSLAATTSYPVPLVAVAHSCLATWWRAVGHGPMPREFVWRSRLMASGLGAADAVIAPSRSFAAALSVVYGTKVAARIAVVPNGRSPRRTVSTPKARMVFTAGRLWDRGKNAAALDRVAARLAAPVVGAGQLVGPNGASERLSHLRLLGVLVDRELARWYETAAVFASLARYEPFGLAALEAAQAGAALVLSDIPTFRELWDGAAVFVDPDDDDRLLAILQTLLDAPSQCAKVALRCHDHALRYSADAMVRGTLSVYGQAMRSRVLAQAR